MRSRLKYNLEDIMSIEQIGKGFEGNNDQIKDYTFLYIYKDPEFFKKFKKT